MHAAIVESFERPPHFGEFRNPEPGEHEVGVTVAAAALSNLVKGRASGRHYSSGTEIPFVPGIDGVGRLDSGERVYFLAPRAPFGSMAERSVAHRENVVPLPHDIDDATAAALGNPGLASWGSLLGRARLQSGETVLVNGATGVSGTQAVQVARFLGARRIIATGRDEAALQKLLRLGADEVISLQQDEAALQKAFARALSAEGGTQVVLDFIFGRAAELLLRSAGGHGSAEGEPRIRFVQIGSASGRTIELSAEWLRSSGVELLGSGLGSLSTAEILQALRRMYDSYGQGGFKIETDVRPLREVERSWKETEAGRRIVFTMA